MVAYSVYCRVCCDFLTDDGIDFDFQHVGLGGILDKCPFSIESKYF